MKMDVGSSFIKYLKDEKFIEWKLLSSDELKLFWNEYLEKYPNEKTNIVLAEERLRALYSSKSQLSIHEKDVYMRKLEESLRSYSRKRTIRRYVYIAAACLSLLLITVLYFTNESDNNEPELVMSPDYIVGNELESKDILFTTGNNTSSFSKNIEIEIQSGNRAKIKGNDLVESDIEIAQNSMNKLVVPYGKQSKLQLPDGTKVWLNSGSILEFPTNYDGETVMVRLSGEMYIEVEPDNKRVFIVNTPDFDVRVYGTKFNVTSYDKFNSSVVLVEGSVGLSSNKNKEIMLIPSEQAILTETGGFVKESVDVNLFTSWKDGYLTFNETPILEALKQIERYYNLSFKFDENIAFSGNTCTGKIILSDNLDNVLTTLTLISSTNYKRENNSIYIYKNN